jgi:hypothetical protein
LLWIPVIGAGSTIVVFVDPVVPAYRTVLAGIPVALAGLGAVGFAGRAVDTDRTSCASYGNFSFSFAAVIPMHISICGTTLLVGLLLIGNTASQAGLDILTTGAALIITILIYIALISTRVQPIGIVAYANSKGFIFTTQSLIALQAFFALVGTPGTGLSVTCVVRYEGVATRHT